MERKNLEKYIGNQAQLGGTRHYVLTEGRARCLRAIDINTGSGLNYTILPDRGMDISLAAYKGTNLVFLTCNGETHPAYYEPEGIGWLNTFAGGLLTTCGLTYLGPPVIDDGVELGLHGRYSTIPACRVADLSSWVDDDYIIKIKGVVEEGRIFGNKLRLEREITSVLGQNNINIRDRITNFGSSQSPYMILYHLNFGYPLLSEHCELLIDPVKTDPVNKSAETSLIDYKKIIKPQLDFQEQVFCHTMKGSDTGEAVVSLINRLNGTSLQIRFNINQLPYLIQWKMMGYGDYVMGLEPSNVPLKNRKDLKNEGTLPYIQPGMSVINDLEISLSEAM
ncbi:MAG: aldose 1-epimerase family protein [Bacteroidales bacterium]